MFYKKNILTTLFTTAILTSSLFGADGYEIYKKNCMECHVEMMQAKVALKNLDKLKAPPMVEVSNRLRENIVVKDDDDDVHRYLVTLFIKDYIQNPNLQNSMCHAGALERFGVMPKLKNKLTDIEKQAVAEWIYDRYEDVKF